jgi:hypothetical protein
MGGLFFTPGIAQAQSKAVGVQAWISGSHTYIRIRPNVTTPPVAKVAAHTPVFVWGKKDGWYRVETKDHKFGWVFYSYINSPDLAKVHELTDHKAHMASLRTSSQKLYGSPELLASYKERFHDKQTLQNLHQHKLALKEVAAKKQAAELAHKLQLARAAQHAVKQVSAPAHKAAPQAVVSRVSQATEFPRKTFAGQDLSLASSHAAS